jgi:hypothetical protein
MSTVELKHTWTLDRDSRLLRFYLWAWEGDPSAVTFCKLFWGYVFAPLNLLARLVWLVIWPLRAAIAKANEYDKRHAKERPAKERPKPRPKEEIPGRISVFFARPIPRLVAKIVGALVLLVTAPAALFGVGWVLYRFGVWVATTDAKWVVGYGLFMAVVFIASHWLDQRYDLDARWEARKARKRAKGGVTLGDVFVEGAKAVKSNTCPRIEVRQEKRR